MIKVAGKKRSVTTTAQTVGEALSEAKIAVDSDDKISVAKTAALVDGAKFSYTRVDVKRVTKKQKVAYGTVRKESGKLAKGVTKVDKAGVSGARAVTYRVVRHNGKIISRKKVGSKITRKPVAQIVLVGTKAPKTEQCAERGRRQCLGQDRPVRVRRQLVDQHRQRLLRRPAVHAEHLARVRRVRHAEPRQPRPADRGGQEGPGRCRAGEPGRPAPASWVFVSAQPFGLLDPSSVRELVGRLGLRPSKQRGQNFVTDANTVRRIVAASGVGADDVVLEIGPGLGSLTLGLLEVAAPGGRGGDRSAAGRRARRRPWRPGCRTGRTR